MQPGSDNNAAAAPEPLVFGEMEQAPAEQQQESSEATPFSTPLAVTRAPSAVPESPGVAFHSPESPKASTVATAAAAGATPASEGGAAGAAGAALLSAAATALASASDGEQPEACVAEGQGDGGSNSSEDADETSPSTADADSTGPASAAGAAADVLHGSTQSGLLSLHELTLGSSAEQQQQQSQQQKLQPPPPSGSDSPSAASTSSSASEADAAADDAADPAAASAAAAPASAAAAAAAAAGKGAGGMVSPWQQQQHHHHHHQQHHQQQQPGPSWPSPPCSPVAGGAGGLDRTASWQLQHAAAAAAGTASHPAPPRSDIDLAKISNTPASPHGEAGWAAWQARRRHFFVLTAAGKPVYSRHGDEQALAGFMAVIQALLSVMTDQGDVIQRLSVGPATSLVFLVRGQLYLVAVSSRDEAPAALSRQLELLYQCILTAVTGGVERLLQRSPGYDVQQLLSGSQATMNALVSGFGDCPGWMFGSVEPATASGADRQALTAALQQGVKACECLYGVLLVGGRVMAVERGPGTPALNPFDLLLLVNFTNSNESLRHNETFVPVCLPNFQPNALVHAYVRALDNAAAQHQPQQEQEQQPPPNGSSNSGGSGGSSTFLLLLSGSADAFHKLSAAQQAFAAAVGGPGGVLAKVQAAALLWPGRARVRVEALPAPLGGPVGNTPLWHAIIRYPQRHQHVCLAYPPQLFSTRSQVKQLVRSYCRLHCAAYAQVLEQGAAATAAGPFGSGSGSSSGSSGSSGLGGIVGASAHQLAAAAAGAGGARVHKLVWVTSQRWVTGVLVDRDVELYVTLDPLTEKDVGLKLAETLRRLFADKRRQQELLIPGL